MNTQDLIALAEKHGAKVTTLGAATDPVFAFNERAMQAFCAALAASLREKEDAAHMFADFLLLKHCHAFINHENITKYLTEFDAQRLGREKENGNG